jgi:hypothetical protein
MKTVTALFETRAAAAHAVDAMIQAGHRRESISVVMQRMPNEGGDGPEAALGRHVAEGAGVGAAMGGVAGFVALGLAAIVPGVGVIAAGPLVAALVGAAAGGAVGTLAGALVGAGLTDLDAARTAQLLAKGGVLVAVDVDDAKAGPVLRALSHLGGHELMSVAA